MPQCRPITVIGSHVLLEISMQKISFIYMSSQFLMVNIEMKSSCEKILHPTTINTVSCTYNNGIA